MANLDQGSSQRYEIGDDASSFPSSLSAQQAPSPIWRFKPKLPSVRRFKSQIIPRIFLALRPTLSSQRPAEAERQAEHRIAPFAALATGNDDDACAQFVATLLADGIAVDQIFVAWLAPTARYLGEQWENDLADFVTVTIGISRLQRVLHTLGEKFAEEAEPCGGGAILLTTPTGDLHSFGLSMVAEFFRRAGWSLCTGPFATQNDLLALVHERWFDVVGFSVSSARHLDTVKRDIASVRSGSRNPHLGIMLGGPMLAAHPELVTTLGADMMSADAMTAPNDASALIGRMTRRS